MKNDMKNYRIIKRKREWKAEVKYLFYVQRQTNFLWFKRWKELDYFKTENDAVKAIEELIEADSISEEQIIAEY